MYKDFWFLWNEVFPELNLLRIYSDLQKKIESYETILDLILRDEIFYEKVLSIDLKRLLHRFSISRAINFLLSNFPLGNYSGLHQE